MSSRGSVWLRLAPHFVLASGFGGSAILAAMLRYRQRAASSLSLEYLPVLAAALLGIVLVALVAARLYQEPLSIRGIVISAVVAAVVGFLVQSLTAPVGLVVGLQAWMPRPVVGYALWATALAVGLALSWRGPRSRLVLLFAIALALAALIPLVEGDLGVLTPFEPFTLPGLLAFWPLSTGAAALALAATAAWLTRRVSPSVEQADRADCI